PSPPPRPTAGVLRAGPPTRARLGKSTQRKQTPTAHRPGAQTHATRLPPQYADRRGYGGSSPHPSEAREINTERSSGRSAQPAYSSTTTWSVPQHPGSTRRPVAVPLASDARAQMLTV